MRAAAQAQPNFALIKYWGKKDLDSNLPAVGSLSITLDSLWTRMTVEYSDDFGEDRLQVNGRSDQPMLPRIVHCLDLVAGKGRSPAMVHSQSNFPIGAGLASSASAFAALVVAAEAAAGGSRGTLPLARLAGRASGSAARSLFGGFAELTVIDEVIEVEQLLAHHDWPLQVIVALTAETAKPLGSGDGMIRSAATSPFYSSWVGQQEQDLTTAHAAVMTRNFDKLAAVAEHNCLKMHSVMWTSRPPIVYWNRSTLSCMETVRDLQNDGHAVFFTIDAGPQLKAVCLPDAATAVAAALAETPGVIRVMQSGLGPGARLLETE